MEKALIWASIFASSVFSLCQAEVRYTVTDLGTLGGEWSDASSINDVGQIAGASDSTVGRRAFLYDNGTMTDLGTLGGNDSYAYGGINESGQIAGTSRSHAFLYDSGTMTDLGTLGAYSGYSSAYGINDFGQVVGTSFSGDRHHAFLYDSGMMTDLGSLGGTNSEASGINNSGQIVGGSHITGNIAYRAFLYDSGTMIDLGTLGGSRSYAYGVNNNGQVVGHSITAEGTYHAFLYDNGTMTDLGTLGGTASHAYGVNANEQIVGRSYTLTEDNHAFLYDSMEGMLDLNDLIDSNSGWVLQFARDINSSGHIVGYGNIGGKKHAYLLSPIPEPAILVPLDIKPQSCPNPLNVKSKGVFDVAILGTDDFDVRDIDLSTISLEGVAPLRNRYEDETSPVVNGQECECRSKKKDGYLDLTLKFDTQEIVATLGEVSDDDMWMLHLTGALQDGTEIEGTDCIEIIKKGK